MQDLSLLTSSNICKTFNYPLLSSQDFMANLPAGSLSHSAHFTVNFQEKKALKCNTIPPHQFSCVVLQLLVHADRACSLHPGIKGPNKSRKQARPDWVALWFQQTDHLSLLWSPYKSSTFPLFSSAAHKFIKLAFPCCFWQKQMREGSVRCIMGGRRLWGPTHTSTVHVVQPGVYHKTAALTRMIRAQPLLSAE